MLGFWPFTETFKSISRYIGSLVRARIGMRMSCKYYYRGGLCANSQMEKPFCVGEDNCEFINKPQAPSKNTGPAKIITPELKLNTIVVQDGGESEDPMSQWMGVYCPHYQRFYCTGGADGCKAGSCATAEGYHKALSEHMEKVK